MIPQEQRLREALQQWREVADEINAGNREQKRDEIMVLRSCAFQIEALLNVVEPPAPSSLSDAAGNLSYELKNTPMTEWQALIESHLNAFLTTAMPARVRRRRNR
jgi:hypothetical protein